MNLVDMVKTQKKQLRSSQDVCKPGFIAGVYEEHEKKMVLEKGGEGGGGRS